MDKILLNSNAKINLSLDVLGRRADGYHEVKMIMNQCGLCDCVLLEKRKGGIELYTNLRYLPADEKNIAYQAAAAFFSFTGLNGGVRIQITKHIPVAAGLAGGSGNCAAVLYGLNQLFDTKLTQQQLMQIGEKLGADVPYCIAGGTMLAEGIGERLTPIAALGRMPIVIVKPRLSLSTAKIYQKLDEQAQIFHPDTDALIRALERRDIRLAASLMANVMEAVSASEHPIITVLKQQLLRAGAIGALMSGSGPSVFALFEQFSDAKKAVEPYRQKYFTYVGWTK